MPRAVHRDAHADFNPRSPHGERQGDDLLRVLLEQFQPTLPARGATRVQFAQVDVALISTHAPRTGSDRKAIKKPDAIRQFQPTLPARGATRLFCFRRFRQIRISTHAPRTGSDDALPVLPERPHISTHAPRTGSDDALPVLPERPHISTHAPRTGSDHTARSFLEIMVISTHAPRTGSDVRAHRRGFGCDDFNPRSPHGERPAPPSRAKRRGFYFNPRSPHGERRTCCRSPAARMHFNPRSPHGERQSATEPCASVSTFQPTLPARGATRGDHGNRPRGRDFNPRSPHGERRPETP